MRTEAIVRRFSFVQISRCASWLFCSTSCQQAQAIAKGKEGNRKELTRREEVRIAVGWHLQVFGTKPVEEGHRVTNLEEPTAGRQLATGWQDQVGLTATQEPGKAAQGSRI
jgi:hypothetical protein